MQLPVAGDVLGNKYRIDEVLGEGGFGCVYLGTARASNRQVAIKVLKPTTDGYVAARTARFLREMQAIAKLQSPYTLTLFDVGQTDDGLLFMVTEYVAGDDLDQVLANRGAMTERETAHIVMQLAMSLTEAHRMGILHRDIKPSNIRVFEYDGDPLRVKLLDFGLAKTLGSDESRLTGTGRVIGTPRYMAPERLIGDDLTGASDVYSLGLVARECVLGRQSVAGAASRQLDTTDDVSPAFREIVNRMLVTDADARIADPHEVYELFRARRHELDQRHTSPPLPLQAKAPTTQLDPPPQPVTTTTHRRRLPIAIATAGVFVVVGLGMFTLADKTPVRAPQSTVNRLPPSLVKNVQPVIEAQPSVTDREEPASNSCPDFDGVTGNVEITVSNDILSLPDDIQVYVPRDYRPTKSYPLIVAFRDFRSSSLAIIRRSRLRRQADRLGYVIVAPKDVDSLEGVWERPEDLDNARKAVAEVKRRYCIDDSRIFAYGHGMGGRGVERFICDVPGVAGAVTTAFRPSQKDDLPCKYGSAVPRLNFDPRDNPRAPTDGGAGCGIVAPVMSLAAYEERLRDEGRCADSSQPWLDHEHGRCREWACESAPRVTCRVDGGREFFGTTPRDGGLHPNCDGEPVDFPYEDYIYRFFEEVSAR